MHDAVRFTHACPLVPGAIAAGGFVADPALARHIPLGRLGRSEDLAPMALAVLSNRLSAYVTGPRSWSTAACR